MIAGFLFILAAGILFVLAAGRPVELAWRFLRLVGLISFGLMFGTTLWLWRTTTSLDTVRPTLAITVGAAACAPLVVLILLAPIAARRPAAFRAFAILAGIAGLAAAWAMPAYQSSKALEGTLPTAMLLISHVLAALLLGSITVAWLLGHAYLTATKMTIAPLRRYTTLLIVSIAARAVFVAISLLIAWLSQAAGPEDSRILHALFDNWLVLFLRIGVGIVAVAVFAWMVRDCVRLRSTQSATGILYFGSIFAYVGELAARQLTLEAAWPL